MMDSLGDRMKGYENAFRHVLPGRMPVIVRVDGKAFHTLTRDCAKPFDTHLSHCMDVVGFGLCEEIQGAQIAFIQSDEVNVLVHGYKRLNTSPWFDNNLQKIVSVSAATATRAFNRSAKRIGVFDARAFVLPEHEVCNYFIWRQNDTMRNSITMVAQSMFSHKELHGKSCAEMQEMMFQKGTNWNDLSPYYKRGRCVIRNADGAWYMPDEIPTFKEDRAFIEQHLVCEE